MNDNGFSKISQIIQAQTSFAICLAEKPSADTIAAACSLYLALTKLGKDVTLASSGEIPKDISFVGIDKIQKKLGGGGDTLIVAFPYSEGSIDKVTYNIEENKFNLLIQPRAGFAKLDPKQVTYSYAGGQVGALFILDAPNLQTLGSLYSSQQDQFKGKDIINIDRHLTNANYGTVNIVERQASSLSEIMSELFKVLNLEMDRDIATNLYNGIVAATNNFTSYSVNAHTFEACAFLLKHGAIKRTPRPVRSQSAPQIAQSHTMPRPQAHSNSFPTPAQDENPIEDIENKEVKANSSDWLRPKIFGGNDITEG